MTGMPKRIWAWDGEYGPCWSDESIEVDPNNYDTAEYLRADLITNRLVTIDDVDDLVDLILHHRGSGKGTVGWPTAVHNAVLEFKHGQK